MASEPLPSLSLIDLTIPIPSIQSVHPYSETEEEAIPFDIESVGYASKRAEVVVRSSSARERKVLELRYGIEKGEEHTLEEISRPFGLSRERIRQIEGKAIERLRQSSHCEGMGNILEGLRPEEPQNGLKN